MSRISYILLLALCLACCLPFAYSEATGVPSQAENKGFLTNPAESEKEQSEEAMEIENEEEMRVDEPNNYDDLPSENIEQYFETLRDQIKNEPKRNELNFMVLGDFGLVHKDGPAPSTKALGDFLFHKVKRTFVNYDFIVSVGDIMYEFGINDIMHPEVKFLFEDAFRINELGLEWYNTFGNHDCMGSLPATMQLNERYSLWKQTKPYYSMVKNIGDSNLKVGFLVPNGCDMVCVRKDSEECYRGTHKSIQWDDIPNQIQWIEDQLREMSENKEIIWKVVVLHNAVFSAAKKHGDNKDLIQHLLPLFVKYNVDVVLSGHDHNVQYLRMDRAEFLNHKGNEPIGHDFRKHKEQLKKKNQCTTAEYFHFDLTPTGIRGKDDQYNFLQSLLSERDNFMSYNTPKYSREAFADQDKYLHQFVVGNGGKEKEVFCPFEHNKSLANLRYANAVVGVGDVRITEDKFEVTLLSVKNEVLYTARIYRADRE